MDPEPDSWVQQLVDNFKLSVKAVLRVSVGVPILEESEDTTKLIESIEQILKHGLKDRVNGFAVTYWNFLCQLAKSPGDLGIQGTSFQQEVENTRHDWTTEEEKGRCWIRLAFNSEKIMTLQSLVKDATLLELWYEPDAFLMNHDYVEIFCNLLLGFQQVKFNLALEGPSQNKPAESIQTFRVKKTKSKVPKKGRKRKPGEDDPTASPLVEERRLALEKKALEEKMKQEQEAREQAAREQEIRDRETKEREAKETKEREEREEQERVIREKEAQEAKEREEREKAARELEERLAEEKAEKERQEREKAAREREERNRKAREEEAQREEQRKIEEKEKQERLLREAKELEEKQQQLIREREAKLQREKEQREKDLQDMLAKAQEAQEALERAQREQEEQEALERAQQEQREREEQEAQEAQAQEALERDQRERAAQAAQAALQQQQKEREQQEAIDRANREQEAQKAQAVQEAQAVEEAQNAAQEALQKGKREQEEKETQEKKEILEKAQREKEAQEALEKANKEHQQQAKLAVQQEARVESHPPASSSPVPVSPLLDSTPTTVEKVQDSSAPTIEAGTETSQVAPESNKTDNQFPQDQKVFVKPVVSVASQPRARVVDEDVVSKTKHNAEIQKLKAEYEYRIATMTAAQMKDEIRTKITQETLHNELQKNVQLELELSRHQMSLQQEVKKAQEKSQQEIDKLQAQCESLRQENVLFERRWEKDQEEIMKLKKAKVQAEDKLKEGIPEVEKQIEEIKKSFEAELELKKKEQELVFLKNQEENEKYLKAHRDSIINEAFQEVIEIKQLKNDYEDLKIQFDEQKAVLEAKYKADLHRETESLKQLFQECLEQERRTIRAKVNNQHESSDSPVIGTPSDGKPFPSSWEESYPTSPASSFTEASELATSPPPQLHPRRRISIPPPKPEQTSHDRSDIRDSWNNNKSSVSEESTEDHEEESGSEGIEYINNNETYTPIALSLDDFLKNNYDPAVLEAATAQNYMPPDDDPESDSSVQEEGWVPLKKKVIFKQTKRAVLGTDDPCAGCGQKLVAGWFKSANYCHYSNKYFCSKCHQNYKYLIPSRIFFHWDFKHYPICNFYRNFLTEMFNEPLYDVTVINPSIYKLVPPLSKIRIIRQQLRLMKDFILTCRDKQKLVSLLGHRFYLVDTEMYSLSDLVDVQKDELFKFLRAVTEQWLKHIHECQLCSSKGSICEFCNKKEIIYPFNLKTTVQCPKCKSSAHRGCYSSQTCPKCLRLSSRKTKGAGGAQGEGRSKGGEGSRSKSVRSSSTQPSLSAVPTRRGSQGTPSSNNPFATNPTTPSSPQQTNKQPLPPRKRLTSQVGPK